MSVPSPRTVVFRDTPALLRGRRVTPYVPVWPLKDPGEIVACRADFSPLTGDAAIIQVDVSTAAVRILRVSWAGGVVTLVIGGGADGDVARIAVCLALSDGQRITRAALLPIVAQAASVALPPGALTVAGFALTVAGAPISVGPST